MYDSAAEPALLPNSSLCAWVDLYRNAVITLMGDRFSEELFQKMPLFPRFVKHQLDVTKSFIASDLTEELGAAQKWLKEIMKIDMLPNATHQFDSHSFRRGGAQHRYFNETPSLRRRWRLSEVLAWGGTSQSVPLLIFAGWSIESKGTLVTYLVDMEDARDLSVSGIMNPYRIPGISARDQASVANDRTNQASTNGQGSDQVLAALNKLFEEVKFLTRQSAEQVFLYFTINSKSCRRCKCKRRQIKLTSWKGS